ncbi:MAG: class I SAM-dependent methyltransferase [Actinomycetota bacterium]
MDEHPREDPEVRRALIEWSDANRGAWEAAVERGDRARLRALYEEMGVILAGLKRARPDARAVLSREVTNALIRDLAAQTRGARVLDLGCGPTPVSSIAFARSGNVAVACDVAHSVAGLARDEARDAGSVHAIVADAEQLPFAGGTFDVVTCDDTIEHVLDPARALLEIARVARPGGHLLLISPNHGGAHVLLARVREALRGRRHPRRWYFVHDSHTIEFRWRELRRLLGRRWVLARAMPVGWDDVGVGRKGRAMGRLLRLGPLWRLSSSLAVLLRRTGTPAG